MAVYKSQYNELTFYAEGNRHSFRNGTFTTEDAKLIKALDGIVDATRVDEPTKAPTTKQAEETTQKAPAKKAPTRKPSAK